jgi:CcmD family protein
MNWPRLRSLISLAVVWMMVGGGAAFADQLQPRSDPRMNVDLQVRQPPEPPEGFVPASSLPQQEELPAAPLVIAAYAVAWVAVFGYLWSIWQRLGRVEKELAEVSRRIAAGERR